MDTLLLREADDSSSERFQSSCRRRDVSFWLFPEKIHAGGCK
jgi:hypothetical protein